MSDKNVNFYDLTGDLDKAIKLTQDLSFLFYNGFSKLIQKEKDVLNQLAKGFVNSPLREIVPQGIDKLQKSDFHKDNFTALVLAITSIHGSIHDALYAKAEEVLEKKITFLTQESDTTFEEHTEEMSTLLSNIQNWLIDIAIGGFSDLNKESIQSFETVLQTVEDNKELKRLGVILRGLSNEIILVRSDTKEKDYSIQVRWMDLWCKAYLLTLKKQIPSKGRKVNGNLKLLGLQPYVHRNFLTIVFNGILENKKEKIYVEIEKSKFIIDLVPVEEFWFQLKQENQNLIDGLLKSKIIKVSNGVLQQNGNLVLTDHKLTTETFDILDVVQKSADKNSLLISKIQAIDRHPIHFKLPCIIKLEDIKNQTVKIGDKEIPIRFELQPTKRVQRPVTKNNMLMELRFDNGWFFKPLTSIGASNVFLGQISEKISTETPIYSILKERSSKILRDKK